MVKPIENVELGLFRLIGGTEVLVKKEELDAGGCNIFVYQHISNNIENIKLGDFIEDKYLPLGCVYFADSSIPLSKALKSLLPDLTFIRD